MRSPSTLVVAFGLATTLALGSPAQAWSGSYLAGGAVVEDLALGDGDADGTREVYAATWDGTMRYHWDGSAWVETHLGGTGASSVALADADRDGVREVYAGEIQGEVVQYKAGSNGTWTRTVVARLGASFDLPTMSGGDLEGDGLQDLLVAVGNGNGDVYKVFQKHGAWHAVKLAQVHARATSSWVGDGDRDGRPEVYLATSGGDVLELDPDEGWKKSFVGWVGRDGEWLQGVVVADGDGDGLEEVYAVGDNKSLMRFGWTGTSWNRNKVATFPAGLTDLAFGDADGDGRRELYMTSWDGHAYAVHKSGSTWVRTDLGTAEAESLLTVVLGDADNDSATELILGSFHNAQYPYGGLHRITR